MSNGLTKKDLYFRMLIARNIDPKRKNNANSGGVLIPNCGNMPLVTVPPITGIDNPVIV